MKCTEKYGVLINKIAFQLFQLRKKAIKAYINSYMTRGGSRKPEVKDNQDNKKVGNTEGTNQQTNQPTNEQTNQRTTKCRTKRSRRKVKEEEEEQEVKKKDLE